MNADNKYVRFDWAVKRMLRDKANFGVLEGLITVLLNEPVHIVELLESEGNQEAYDDKFNRVDVKAKNDAGEIFLVEVQLTREIYYLERILYGTAKAITEHIHLGNTYSEIKKIYSINIIYFELGKGADYLYHGQNKFVGVHTHDTLKVSTKEDGVIRLRLPEEIFPEYFIIRVNEFNQVAKTPLEEWLDYLKNGHIKDDTTAPGLQEARRKLQYMMLDKKERYAYDEHINAVMIQNDVLGNARLEGLAEGREEGRILGREEGRILGKEEGRAEGRAEGERQKAMEFARMLIADGESKEKIARYTGLSTEEIEKLT